VVRSFVDSAASCIVHSIYHDVTLARLSTTQLAPALVPAALKAGARLCAVPLGDCVKAEVQARGRLHLGGSDRIRVSSWRSALRFVPWTVQRLREAVRKLPVEHLHAGSLALGEAERRSLVLP
jgi:hypothetical protein